MACIAWTRASHFASTKEPRHCVPILRDTIFGLQLFFGSFSVAEWNVHLQHCNYVIILEVPDFAIVFLCISCRGHRWHGAVIPCRRLSQLAYVVPTALRRIDRTVQEQMVLIASRKGWFVFYVRGVTQVCSSFFFFLVKSVGSYAHFRALFVHVECK